MNLLVEREIVVDNKPEEQLKSIIQKNLKDSNSSQLDNSKQEKAPKKSTSQSNKLFDYDGFFEDKINAKKKDGSYRYFKKISRKAEVFPVVSEKYGAETRPVTIWCSNDYLGLGRHPYVQAKVCEAVQEYGVGSGGTRNISGSNPLHEKLEEELAK